MTGRGPAEFAHWPDSLAADWGPYRAVVRRIVDGDTFDCLIDLGWNDYHYHAVRLLSVDAPETNRAPTRDAGLAATEFVRNLMPVGDRVLLVDPRPDPDSFGRYLVRIQLEDGSDLTQLILDAGHGVPA